MSRVRLVPIVVIVIVSLAVMFGVYRIYLHYNLVGPLESRIESIQGVQSVKVVSGNQNQVRVQLGQVSDLQTTYVKIQSSIGDALGSGGVVYIEDRKDAELISAYEDFQPSISEGMAKGNYREMIQSVEQQAHQLGINARITMDEHNIYIQLAKGKAYFYRVVPYSIH